VRSKAFADWVANQRFKAQMTQLQASLDAGISQQDWSRMQRQGLIPSNDQLLERICRALGSSVAEAKQVIEVALGAQVDTAPFEAQYLAYKESIIELGRQQRPVSLFIIREDPEPTDYVAIREYIEVLTRADHISFVLLFRYPNPQVWRSYFQLLGAITEALPAMDSAAINRRVRALYRHPHYAENMDTSLPMYHPHVLTSGQSGMNLAAFVFDERIKREGIVAGLDEPQAVQRSLCIVRQDVRAARQIASWIGLRSPLEHLPNLWVPIEVQ
jgi:hypothetical protein